MARRVNTKALIIFSVIVVGGVASLLAAPTVIRMVKGDRSAKLVIAADALVKEAETAEPASAKRDKLEEAARNYTQAAATDTKNPELLVKLGDAYNRLTQFDQYQYIRAARVQWDRALEIDPANKPALRRLVESYFQQTQLSPQAQWFSVLEEKATALAKLDPDDLHARALTFIAPLNQWLANIETPPVKVDKAIEELQTLIQKNPTAKDIPDMVFFCATAMAKKGAEMRRGGQERSGNELLDASVKTFENAIRENDDNAYLHFRFFELLSVIRGEDAERDNVKRYTETMRQELETALDLSAKSLKDGKPADEQSFVKIYIAASQFYAGRNLRDRAEKILLDLQNAMPKDQRVRLALAKLWRHNPDKREAAVALLEAPVEYIGFEGVEAQRRRGLEFETFAELTGMYIDRYPTLNEDQRADALKQIEATHARALDLFGENSIILKLRGKIEILRGGADAPIRAIQTYEKAQNAYRVERQGKEDPEIIFLLARAYYASRQTGQAKQQLVKFVRLAPDNVVARLMLAQILVQEGEINAAREHVKYLETLAPELPDVLRLRIAVLDPIKDAALVKTLFAELKEDTREARAIKIQQAMLPPVSDPQEALRLHKLNLAENPADFESLHAAKEILTDGGRSDDKARKDEALALLQAGQKAKPDDARIGLLIQSLQSGNSDALIASSEKLIRETYKDDPYMLNLKLYEFTTATKGRKDAFPFLQAAEKAKDDDGRVQDLLFQYWAAEQNWDKAAWYVDRLAAKNWDQAGGLIYRFRMAMIRGDIEGATGYARELTQKLPEFARSWVFLAQALQASKQLDSAVSNYMVALEKQSENPDAIAGIIACYLELKRPNDAARYIEQGRKSHPNNPYFQEQWKNFQINYGNPTAVIDPAKKERDASPKDPAKWINLGRAQFLAARKAQADNPQQSAQLMADAKATFSEALKQWPAEKILWAFLAEISTAQQDFAGGEALLKDMMAREQFKGAPEPRMMLADHYLAFAKPDLAEATMKQTVDLFKDNVDVRRRLAAYYTQNKRFDDALKLLDPSSPDKLVRQQIVEIYMLGGRFPEAEKLLRGLLTTNAKDAQLHALLGVVLLNQGKTEQALESMNTALAEDPKNQAALYSRGHHRLTAQVPQLDDAIKDLALLRDINPNHIEARVSLAKAYKQKLQFTEAARELEDALRRDPARRDVRLDLVGIYATSMKPPSWSDAERLTREGEQREPKDSLWKRMIAKMQSLRGQHEQAARTIREAAILDPKNGDIVREYFDILEAAKMWAQLERETNNLLASDKTMADKGWWVYVKRAVAERNTDKRQEAMKDFEKAFDIVVNDKDASQDVLISIVDKIREHIGADEAIARVSGLARGAGATPTRWKVVLAYLHHQNGDNKKAAEVIEEARRDASTLDERNQATALNIAGTIYMMSGEYDKARTAYEELLAKRPDELAALNNLAFIMAEHSTPPNIAKAMELSTRAYNTMSSKNAQDASVLDTVGWVNVLSGGTNLDRGIEHLWNSIKINEIPEAHYHLGEAFLLKKAPEEAKRSLTRAQEMIQERKEKKQPIDENLRNKVEQAMIRAEKALLEPRAGS